MPDHALVIDIGGTKIAAGVLRADGTLSHSAICATPAVEGADAILKAVARLGQQVRAAAGADGIEPGAVGVGAAGVIDTDRGVVVFAGATLTDWAGAALADHLEAVFGLPVVVENDVNALALGELHFGAGQGLSDALVIAVGTGVGGALIQNGAVYRGATFSAGEIAHLVVELKGGRRCNCGQDGHLEAYTAGPAIAMRYRELAGHEGPLDLRAVALRAEAGDRWADQAIAEGAATLGRVLAGVLAVLDPQALIVGGGVADLGPRWWTPFATTLRGGALPGPAGVPILPARHGGRAVLLGAGWLALSRS